MSLHCSVIPQAVSDAVRHAASARSHHAIGAALHRVPGLVRSLPTGIGRVADTCSSALAPYRSLQNLAALPAAALLAAGLASAGPGAIGGGLGSGGGGGLAGAGAGSGGRAAPALAPAPTLFDATTSAAGTGPDVLREDGMQAATLASVGARPGNSTPDFAPFLDLHPLIVGGPAQVAPIVPADDMPVSVPEPMGVAGVGFAMVAAVAAWARRPQRR